MTLVTRPDILKVFANLAKSRDYLPVEFGGHKLVHEDYEKIANLNFEYGIESLQEAMQLKDLNSVFYYITSVIKHLYQTGNPLFSSFEHYFKGAMVNYDGKVYLATKDIEPTTSFKPLEENDKCCCPTTRLTQPTEIIGTAINPDEQNSGWILIASMEEIKVLQANIDDIKDKAVASIKRKDTTSNDLEVTTGIGSNQVKTTISQNFDIGVSYDANTKKVSITPPYESTKEIDISDPRDVQIKNLSGSETIAWGHSSKN